MYTQLFIVYGNNVEPLVELLEPEFNNPYWKSESKDIFVFVINRVYYRVRDPIIATIILEFINPDTCHITVIMGGGGRGYLFPPMLPAEGVFLDYLEEFLNSLTEGTDWQVSRVEKE